MLAYAIKSIKRKPLFARFGANGTRRNAQFCLDVSAKVRHIGESQLHGYLLHRQVGMQQQVFDAIDEYAVDELLGGLPAAQFAHMGEIFGRHVQLGGIILNRAVGDVARRDVVVHHGDEFFEQHIALAHRHRRVVSVKALLFLIALQFAKECQGEVRNHRIKHATAKYGYTLEQQLLIAIEQMHKLVVEVHKWQHALVENLCPLDALVADNRQQEVVGQHYGIALEVGAGFAIAQHQVRWAHNHIMTLAHYCHLVHLKLYLAFCNKQECERAS